MAGFLLNAAKAGFPPGTRLALAGADTDHMQWRFMAAAEAGEIFVIRRELGYFIRLDPEDPIAANELERALIHLLGAPVEPPSIEPDIAKLDAETLKVAEGLLAEVRQMLATLDKKQPAPAAATKQKPPTLPPAVELRQALARWEKACATSSADLASAWRVFRREVAGLRRRSRR